MPHSVRANDDGKFDWDKMYYLARKFLQMNREEFWSSTMREHQALINNALEIEGIKKPEVNTKENDALLDLLL